MGTRARWPKVTSQDTFCATGHHNGMHANLVTFWPKHQLLGEPGVDVEASGSAPADIVLSLWQAQMAVNNGLLDWTTGLITKFILRFENCIIMEVPPRHRLHCDYLTGLERATAFDFTLLVDLFF